MHQESKKRPIRVLIKIKHENKIQQPYPLFSFENLSYLKHKIMSISADWETEQKEDHGLPSQRW